MLLLHPFLFFGEKLANMICTHTQIFIVYKNNHTGVNNTDADTDTKYGRANIFAIVTHKRSINHMHIVTDTKKGLKPISNGCNRRIAQCVLFNLAYKTKNANERNTDSRNPRLLLNQNERYGKSFFFISILC